MSPFQLTLRRPGVGRRMLALLSLGFAALFCVGATGLASGLRSYAYGRAVDHTQQVRREAGLALARTVQAESAQRAFLVTRDKAFLDQSRRAAAEARRRARGLAALVMDNPPQAERARALALAVDERLALLEARVAEAVPGAGPSGERLGEAHMAAVRGLVAAMDHVEEGLLAKRAEAFARLGRLSVVANVIGLGLALLVSVACVEVARRYLVEVARSRDLSRAANRDLERKVSERTLDLMRANEEIQRFAYIVSHDLRAPLVNITGYTTELETSAEVLARQVRVVQARAPELLEPEALEAIDRDLPEALGFIRSSTARMDRLIGAILKLSRAGRRDLVLEPVDVHAAVVDIARSLNSQARSSGAEIVIEPLPSLLSDRISIEMIFANLLDNAVKYGEPDHPNRIAVSGRREGGRVRYAVQDSGRGIDPRDRERVFDLFRRSGRQDRPGEGLGLAFVRSAVRRLGGEIAIVDTPGLGVRFELDLPDLSAPETRSAA